MKRSLLIIILLSIFTLSAVFVYNRFWDEWTKGPEQPKIIPPKTLYGIKVEDYKIVVDSVNNGETIGSIMTKYGISATLIHKIGQMSCDSLNLTMIHVGQKYTVFIDTLTDTVPRTKYLIYENGLIVFTKYDFSIVDSVMAQKCRKEVDTLHKSASGVIQSSLWNTLVEQELSWELAIKLSQTFAWTIDFYGLQKGDYFKVLYSELNVEGKSIGNIEIESAVFHHGGKDLWAIPFVQDSVMQFFDTTGMSMKKSFLKAPLQYSTVSSRYTNARMHPVFHKVTEHRAVDYSAPAGTPVFAASDGRIAIRGYEGGAGNYIKIAHNSMYATVYMHFSRFGEFQQGDFVKQGDIIGYVGSTGWSTGPHLHYEIHENGYKIDPLTFEAPPAEPVKPENIDKFNIEKIKWIKALNKVKNPL